VVTELLYVDDEPTAPGVYLRSEGDNSPSPEPRSESSCLSPSSDLILLFTVPLGFLPAFFAADDSTTSKEAKGTCHRPSSSDVDH